MSADFPVNFKAGFEFLSVCPASLAFCLNDIILYLEQIRKQNILSFYLPKSVTCIKQPVNICLIVCSHPRRTDMYCKEMSRSESKHTKQKCESRDGRSRSDSHVRTTRSHNRLFIRNSPKTTGNAQHHAPWCQETANSLQMDS